MSINLSKRIGAVGAAIATVLAVAVVVPPTASATANQSAPGLPLSLDWAADQGGYADGNGVGTGFTMVLPSTTGGYLPAKLNVDQQAGLLRIAATSGTSYLTPATTTNGNSLDNGLGVQLDASKTQTISSRVVGLPTTLNAGEAAGIWFGNDQDNYVKFTAVATSGGLMKLQALREIGGASTSADEINGPTVKAGDAVEFALVVDPTAAKVTATFSINGAAVRTLGSQTVPPAFFADATAANGSYAGIFTSSRKNWVVGTAGLGIALDYFRVAAGTVPLTPTPYTPTTSTTTTPTTVPPTSVSTTPTTSVPTTTVPTTTVPTTPTTTVPTTTVPTTTVPTTTVPTTTVPTTATTAPTTTAPVAVPSGTLSVTNTDPAPGNGVVVMSRIQVPKTQYQSFHDKAIVQLGNTGSTTLTVTSLSTSGPFTVTSPWVLPFTLASGKTVNVTVAFTAQSGTWSSGNLAIGSTSTTGSSVSLPLVGYWQMYNEKNLEPSLASIVSRFGYKTVMPASAYSRGAYQSYSADEVLSPYWTLLDPSKSARVTQIAAWHSYPTSGLFSTYAKGAPSAKSLVFTGLKTDAQSALPRNSAWGKGTATFAPQGVFGLVLDLEYSDPTLNDASPDIAAGCRAVQCGQHVRVFKLRGADGAVVPGSYIFVEDYSGINYDYQDNVFVVENLTPAA